jgi:acetyl-CoA carboxylase biotin carboxyl carrier protein
MADGPSEPIDTKLVRKLAGILNDTGLSEIEVELGGLKIRVARTLTAAPQSVTYAAAPAPAPVAAPLAFEAPAAPKGETLPSGDQVKSPMVGAAYLSPQPGAPPFVQVGQTVTAGQTLMIIEAMKTMNPIPAPKAGVVRAILVTDGDPVEFGEPLAIIE